MNIDPTITFGQIMTVVVPLIVAGGGFIMALWLFRLKTQILDAVKGMLNAFIETDKADREKAAATNEARHQEHSQGIADTNRRFSDLASGVSDLKTEVHNFRDHVSRHYVEKDELGELRVAVDKSIDRMQVSLDLAVGTMGDVRDEVIKLTAKAGKSTVPPARRPATKPRS